MRRGCETESVCGASAPLSVGGWIGAVGEGSVGGVRACDYNAALMDLPRLCLSETNSDHISELETGIASLHSVQPVPALSHFLSRH